MINMMSKKWEFETNEGYLADAFLQVLEMFHIPPEDIYIPSFLEMSQIEFRTTYQKRKQIEYVFRRYLNKNYYICDCQLVQIERGEWYAIY